MAKKSKKILTEISAAELLDKMSILEIKLDKIKDNESLKEIDKEYKLLNEAKKSHLEITTDIQNLFIQLKNVNLKLWSIEDEKRECEKNKDFGKKFIELARNVYKFNDERAKIKLEINNSLGSNIKEVKSYE